MSEEELNSPLISIPSSFKAIQKKDELTKYIPTILLLSQPLPPLLDLIQQHLLDPLPRLPVIVLQLSSLELEQLPARVESILMVMRDLGEEGVSFEGEGVEGEEVGLGRWWEREEGGCEVGEVGVRFDVHPGREKERERSARRSAYGTREGGDDGGSRSR